MGREAEVGAGGDYGGWQRWGGTWASIKY
jgi:hypothetical protein